MNSTVKPENDIAMQLAKKAGMKPRDLAELFAAELTNADGIKSVEVAGPGFINITLDSASAAAVVVVLAVVAAGFEHGVHHCGRGCGVERDVDEAGAGRRRLHGPRA